MIDPGQQLGVDREPAVELVPGRRHQPLGELSLEHQDGAAEKRPMQQQLEDERGRDLVGQVSHADVEEGEVALQDVADDDLKLLLQRRALGHASEVLQPF